MRQHDIGAVLPGLGRDVVTAIPSTRRVMLNGFPKSPRLPSRRIPDPHSLQDVLT